MPEKKYRLKMLSPMSGPDVDLPIGAEAEFEEEAAQRLVVRGIAQAITPLPTLAPERRKALADGVVHDTAFRPEYDESGQPCGARFDTAPGPDKRPEPRPIRG